jgi:hypothetical protein
MEAVVTRALSGSAVGQAGFTLVGFHHEADSLYAVKDAKHRAEQFRELFRRWFYRGQFDRPFSDALAELPEVDASVDFVTITGAASRAEERADLASAAGAPIKACEGRAWLGISIQASRFLDRPGLRRWLRHELWHVRDMLDPEFQYDREDLASGPAERLPQRVVQDRYALLWSLSIDARVERAGQLPACSREQRLTRFAAAFPGFSPDRYHAALASIGVTRGLRHPELVEFARTPQCLLGSNLNGKTLHSPLRGSACPLCRFPTFQWADLTQPEKRPIIESIGLAYPKWSREHGICTTCFDLFSIRSGVWA